MSHREPRVGDAGLREVGARLDAINFQGNKSPEFGSRDTNVDAGGLASLLGDSVNEPLAIR